MRRNYVTESSSYPTNRVLSLEEEAVEVAEMAEIGNEITEDNNGQERAADTVQGLENLEAVVTNIEETTPAEAALVDQAVDMATTGTQIDADDIAPSMESYVGKRMAIESIRDSAARIWNSIMEMLKRIWERVETFFYKAFGVLPSIRRRLESLEDAIDAARSKSIENKKVTVTSGVTYLSIDYKPVKKGSELLSAVKELNKTASYVFKDGVEAFAKAGEDIATAISDFDVAKKDESVKKAIEALKSMGDKLNKLPGNSGTGGDSSHHVKYGSQLLGNQRLAAVTAKRSDEAGELGTLDIMRRAGVKWEKSRDKAGQATGSFEFETMSTSEAASLVKELVALVDVLEDYKRGSAWKDVAKARTNLEKASTKAAVELDKVKGSSEADERAALPYYRALVRLNQSYVGWTSTPATQLMSHSVNTINAVISVIKKSLAQYK